MKINGLGNSSFDLEGDIGLDGGVGDPFVDDAPADRPPAQNGASTRLKTPAQPRTLAHSDVPSQPESSEQSAESGAGKPSSHGGFITFVLVVFMFALVIGAVGVCWLLAGDDITKVAVDLVTTHVLSNVDHGTEYYEVLEGISSEDVEVLTAFDATGAKLFERSDNTALCVSIPSAMGTYYVQHDGVTLAHNHPFGGSYSQKDMLTITRLNVQTAIIVTKEGVWHTLKPGSQGWPTEDQIISAYAELIQASLSGEKESMVMVSQTSADTAEYSTTIDGMRELASQFGLSYIVTYTNYATIAAPADLSETAENSEG